MKFFIDTANLEQIKEAQALGVLDGVTTNPSSDGQRRHYGSRKHFTTLLGHL